MPQRRDCIRLLSTCPAVCRTQSKLDTHTCRNVCSQPKSLLHTFYLLTPSGRTFPLLKPVSSAPPPHSVRSLLPKACLNIFRAVRALLSKPENCQLSLSYSDKASTLLRDSLNLGPHCHSSSLDKVHTHSHTKAQALVECMLMSR